MLIYKSETCSSDICGVTTCTTLSGISGAFGLLAHGSV